MNQNNVNQFMNTTFTKHSYDPPTGMGRFDFVYTPSSHLARVTVKVKYEFKGPYDGEGYIAWSEMDKGKFKSKAKDHIERTWSNRFKFICNEPNVSGLFANVQVVLQEEPTLNNAHYLVKVRKTPQNHYEAWSGGCEHGTGVTQYNANFSNWGVEKRSHFGGNAIFNFKEQQVNERFEAMGLKTLSMVHGSSNVVLTSTEKSKFDSFIGEVKRILDGDVTGIYCRVYGCSTEKHINVRAHQRASAVAKHFDQLIPNFFKADSSALGKEKARQILQAKGLQLGAFSGVIFYIDAPESPAKRSIKTDYIVITHEFGHMLGCPDEYKAIACGKVKTRMQLDQLIPTMLSSGYTKTPRGTNAGIDRLHDQQGEFAKLATGAGVAMPAFFPAEATSNSVEVKARDQANQDQKDALRDQFRSRDDSRYRKAVKKLPPVIADKFLSTDSIMYTGQRILEAHCLPIWACLVEQTQQFVSPAEWSIELV